MNVCICACAALILGSGENMCVGDAGVGVQAWPGQTENAKAAIVTRYMWQKRLNASHSHTIIHNKLHNDICCPAAAGPDWKVRQVIADYDVGQLCLGWDI